MAASTLQKEVGLCVAGVKCRQHEFLAFRRILDVVLKKLH